MTDSAAILELRHSRVAEHVTLSTAALSDDQEGVFVAIDEPPPVRTVLTVVQGDERRALQVVSVVEVAERDERGTHGFYGRWVDEDALERASKVGTEHLEDGTPVVQPVIRDNSVVMDVSDAPAMAMPAPVLILEDDTGVVDVRGSSEDADDDESSDESDDDDESTAPSADESADADESSDDESSADDSAAETSDETSTDGEAPADDDSKGSSGGRRSRGRKKRGRKRR